MRKGRKRSGPKTLAVDIGGTGTKLLILDHQGSPLTDRLREKTPQPANPEPVLRLIAALARRAGSFDRVSVGFPGVVKDGVVQTAPNLTTQWHGFNLASALEKRLRRPTRALNDAAVQGYGAVIGSGLELVITLGTGFGSALYRDGRLVAPLELAHHPFRKGSSYEQELGAAALERLGRKKWNRRLQEALDTLQAALLPDRIWIGGGNATEIRLELPARIGTVPNIAGLLGGIRLWHE